MYLLIAEIFTFTLLELKNLLILDCCKNCCANFAEMKQTDRQMDRQADRQTDNVILCVKASGFVAET